MVKNKSPVLYVVATPIGNLNDISQRAISTLKNVDFIACEDTRNTKKLLSHLEIVKKELISYHDHEEQDKSHKIIDRIKSTGETVALVSDAGTPCISDPGYRLIAKAKKENIRVHPIPGPSALTAIVSASGLPSSKLLFCGFLPAKVNALKQEVESWLDSNATVIFYESTRRLEKTMRVISEIYPMAEVCIGRELTKLYEEIETMNVNEALYFVGSHETLKGEATVAVYLGHEKRREKKHTEITEVEITEAARKAFKKGETLKDLLIRYKDCGLSRSDLYQLLLSAKSPED